MVVKRWWSERLGIYLYLRTAPDGFQLTIADQDRPLQVLEFAAEAEARAHAEQVVARHPDGHWRHQPL